MATLSRNSGEGLVRFDSQPLHHNKVVPGWGDFVFLSTLDHFLFILYPLLTTCCVSLRPLCFGRPAGLPSCYGQGFRSIIKGFVCMSTLVKEPVTELGKLLAAPDTIVFPGLGEVVKGTVIAVGRNEVRCDIGGLAVGLIRGPELDKHLDLRVGDDVEATIIELDNEFGELELSLKGAGRKRSWDKIKDLYTQGVVISAKILDANKGGLVTRVENVPAFLPVSQLSPANYPRVSGGEKNKIHEKLRSFVGTTMEVKILDVNEDEEKIVVSEKAVWETKQESVLSQYKVGSEVEGDVTAVTDFGAFVRFDTNLEGLVHISEIAWQRIDHPRDVLKVGDHVRAIIINIEGSKIFLSMKKMVEDPWRTVAKKYNVGQWVKGRVLKINPFGLFVELDQDIHGLAHISELAAKPVKDVNEIARTGDEFEFRIVSIDAENHRLGLSLRKAKEEGKKEAA